MNSETKPNKIFYKRNLPHYQPPGGTLFVTFCLAGALPLKVQKQLEAETKEVEARLSRIESIDERNERADLEHRRMFGKWDKALHLADEGMFWLRRPEIAQLVIQQLHELDGTYYQLEAYCVMSNHVHGVFTPMLRNDKDYHALATIMQLLKGRTAFQANQRLGRAGKFWQAESYDHAVRDEAERLRIIKYVLYNPVQAGLVEHWQEWAWSYCQGNLSEL